MGFIDKVLLLIAGGLTLFLIIAAIVFFYYVIRYKGTNIFTDRGQRRIQEIPKEEVLKILNNLTIKTLSFKKEFFEKAMVGWNKEFSVIIYCNIFRLVIESKAILCFFEQNSDETINKIAAELSTIGLSELGDMVRSSLIESRNETVTNEDLLLKYMWYKLPLRNALLEYIQTNIEKF